MRQRTEIVRAARSGDVLGKLRDDSNIPPAWRSYYARLLTLRRLLSEDVDELERTAHTDTPSVSKHPIEAASDSTNRDITLGLLALESNALGEIDAALQRIRDGHYGICEQTGVSISRDRLQVIPWARCTVKAQAELEEHRALPNPAGLKSITPIRSDTQ